jgi:hypothetical protein
MSQRAVARSLSGTGSGVDVVTVAVLTALAENAARVLNDSGENPVNPSVRTADRDRDGRGAVGHLVPGQAVAGRADRVEDTTQSVGVGDGVAGQARGGGHRGAFPVLVLGPARTRRSGRRYHSR